MTKLSIFCALLALATGCVRKSELTKAQGEVAAQQEKIRLLEEQRVPREDLDQAQADVLTARRKLDELAQELNRTRAELAESQEKVNLAELRLTLPITKGSALVLPPGLVKGSYKLIDDTILYSPDAQLNFGNGVMISSPTGLMMSDQERGIVAGDLIVETPNETMQATNAITDANAGKPEMTADKLNVTKK